MYVVDFLIIRKPTEASQYLNVLISFGGRIQSWQGLLISSSVVWLLGVYFFA